MRNLVQKKNGITLIALVITIVILIILAGVLVNLTLGENGLFTRSKLAKMRYEYAEAKEIIDIKLLTIKSECILDDEKDYTLNTIANSMAEGNEVSIDIINFYPTAKLKQGLSVPEGTISGIVVIANAHPQFEFLIGEISEGKIGIKGVALAKDNPTDMEDFTDISNFEKDILNQGGESVTPTPEAQEPEGIPETETIEPPTDTSGSTIETNTIILMKKYESKKIALEGLSNESYTNINATKDIRIITSGDNKGTIITNDQAGSKDKLTLTLTGTYSGKTYTNNITVYVEPANKTTVTDKQGQTQEAYAIYDVIDLVRFKDIINNFDQTKNAALMQNINLNNVEWGIPIGWYTTNDNLGDWAKWTNKEQRGPWGTYKGIFDGKDKEIQNFSYNGQAGETERVGLFGGTQGAYIKNIKFRNPTITTASHNFVGVLAGVINNTKIEHIQILNGSVTVTGTHEEIGGLIGGAYTNSEILRCANNATVTATDSNSVGGICGIISANSSITESLNNSQISGTQFVAGIAGQNAISLVQNTYNTGKIITKSGNSGGICGIIGCDDTNKYAKVYNSYNKGQIQINENETTISSIGGIVGIAFSRGECKYCYNSVDMSANNDNVEGVGGIIGKNLALTSSLSSNSNYVSKLIHCWNEGNLQSTGKHFGGIAGDNGKYCTIENSYITTNATVKYGNDEIVAFTGNTENTYRGKYVGYDVDAHAGVGTATTNKSIYEVLNEFSSTESSIWTNETYPRLEWEIKNNN